MELYLKFIFNAIKDPVWILALIAAIAFVLPAIAQQSTASVSPQSPIASPADNPTPSDPAADDSTESMFPHFKDSRFWLSGQANFVFQVHPDFPALYSGTHSLSS